MTVIAKTPRMLIRHFREDDLDALSQILADPQVMYFSSTGAMTREQTQQFLGRVLLSYRQKGFGLFAVFHNEEQLIGYCGLIVQTIDGQEEVEIGYRFAYRYWGQGLATEAAIATRNYAWGNLRLERLITIIDPKNFRSIRVAQKLGMVYKKDSIYRNIPVKIYELKKVAQ